MGTLLGKFHPLGAAYPFQAVTKTLSRKILASPLTLLAGEWGVKPMSTFACRARVAAIISDRDPPPRG
jgi:hypothetical protein